MNLCKKCGSELFHETQLDFWYCIHCANENYFKPLSLRTRERITNVPAYLKEEEEWKSEV